MQKRLLLAGLILGGGLAVSLGAANMPPPGLMPESAAERPIRGVSMPSEDRTLSFRQPGLISKVLVNEGDTVNKGQLVAHLDDEAEQMQLLSDKQDVVDAKTEFDVETAIQKQDTVTLGHYLAARASPVEIEDQQQKVTVDEARVKLAAGKQTAAELKVRATEALLKKMDVICPIDGVVAKQYQYEGEVSDTGKIQLLRVIQVDPMWVEAQVPTPQARKLKKGDSAYVTLSDKDHKVPPGKVIFISPLASSANETLTVRIEVPNPEKLQPGENVTVKFGGEAAVGVASP